ncbi:MAG: cytochrome C oxidase subunit IV family protein [Chloroflexi bacterium]|nr:cytochrome C oxidase subunit IV family protein [Chloroflexota bacterium]
MSSEPHAIPAAHTEAGHEHHPGPAVYVMIGVILLILTVIEVGAYYVEALRAIPFGLVTVLLTLMVIKFVLVVLFFMHLKFDNRLFAGLFTVPLLVATAILIALLALTGALYLSGVDVISATPATTGH